MVKLALQLCKMALYEKMQKSDDEDDLEALRLAALQTLGSNKPPAQLSTVLPYKPPARARGYRGQLPRTRPGRNPTFQTHRMNSNLIAIVPISNSPSPGGNDSEHLKSVSGELTHKLSLPQHRYCKPDSVQEVKEGSPVSTKFSRYDDGSNSETSADESDDKGSSSDEASAESDNDPDVLVMKAEDEEDSLEKLMDELEQEMNKSDSNVPVNNCVKSNTDTQKQTKTPSSKSKSNCDSKKDTSKSKKSGKSRSKKKSKNKSESFSKVSVLTEATSTMSASDFKKDSMLSVKCSELSSRQTPPRSPHSFTRKSLSLSPRDRNPYSPVRNRTSRSPRRRFSKSPPHLSRNRSKSRSRSRSPMKSLRSPRKRYSRSPPLWSQTSSNNVARSSPIRHSPRRILSQRFSPSPRKSPDRWWPSSRRSSSPQSRRSPLSPLQRYPLSPRNRRASLSPLRRRLSPSPIRRNLSPVRRNISPARRNPSPIRRNPSPTRRNVSPGRRIISPGRRNISPGRRNISPARRNPSPPRRFSPSRRNPSPPRGRYSRSISRSPSRFPPRSRSPLGGRPLCSPKRRISRSPSPRRHLSRSPYGRGPSRYSPVGRRKMSPWSPSKLPPKQRSPFTKRYPISPGNKQRSLSPPMRQKRRSISPSRRPSGNRNLRRSPPRVDMRRPLQESRINNIRHRSRSPQRVLQADSNILRNHSPRRSRSPAHRSVSRTSSISLSPSPDREHSNKTRYKSPLRLHTSEYRNLKPALKEDSSNRQRNVSSAEEDTSNPSKKPMKKLTKRKEVRNKVQKRSDMEDSKKDTVTYNKEEQGLVTEEKVCKRELNDDLKPGGAVVTDSILAVLEARRRKFENTIPVKPDGKKIRLKTTQPQEEEIVQAPSEKSEDNLLDDSLLLEADDDLDLDGPCFELQSDGLWSSEESDCDNEGRFKLDVPAQTSEPTKISTFSFTKLLSQSKPIPAQSEKKVSAIGGKNTALESVKDDIKVEKGLEDTSSEVNDPQNLKKSSLVQLQSSKELQNLMKVESSASSNVTETTLDPSLELDEDSEDETGKISKEGDLRAEISRKRAERLAKAGSLHKRVPARLLQSAFEGLVGKKGMKHDREEKQRSERKLDQMKEKAEVRRVLLLKRPSLSSISVTIPKESKRDLNLDAPQPTKLPIRFRLGVPATGSSPEDHPMTKRRNRKVKLKRNVTLGSRPNDKV